MEYDPYSKKRIESFELKLTNNSLKAPLSNNIGNLISTNNNISYLSINKVSNKIDKLLIPKKNNKLNCEDIYLRERNTVKNSQNQKWTNEALNNLTWLKMYSKVLHQQDKDGKFTSVKFKKCNLQKVKF